MRGLRFLFFLLVCFATTANSQHIQISVPEPLYDFGYVRESGGKVYHTFYFENTGTDTAVVKQVTVSCGCTETEFSSNVVPPGKKIQMNASYDPNGRPGFFSKTIEVEFTRDTVLQKVLLLLRGQVIQKEILPATNQDRSSWQLVLKPYWGLTDGPFDHRFLEDDSFRDFINDITYEIDKEGVAQIQLEVFSYDDAWRNDWNLLYTAVRQRVVAELIRREYASTQVFFITKPAVRSNDDGLMHQVKISSVLYNNDLADQSVMISPVQQVVPDYEAAFAMLRADSAGVVYEYIQQHESNVLRREESRLFDFVKQAVTFALLNTGVSIQISALIKSAGNNEAGEWIKKKYPAICREIKKLLADEGIDEKAVDFIIPVVYEDSVRNQLTLRIINTERKSQQLSQSVLDFNAYTAWLKRQEDSLMQLNADINQGLYLPVYYHYFSKDVPFDTLAPEFTRWLNAVAVQLQRGKKIKFLIEASASNSPSSKGLENGYIARKRAKSAHQVLLLALRNRGLKGSELVGFKIAYVHGPLYDEKSYLIQFYDKYQYVRIIPYEEKTLDKSDVSAIKPYQVTFTTNAFKIPVNSPVFRSFIQRILVVIKKYGYLQINLESSSSTIPTLDFKNNYVLSYQRILHCRDVLRTELLRNGIDPARLIIREERALVQGPRFSPQLIKNKQALEMYQYIKILPFSTE